jgi:hypothetical protein
MFNRVGGGRGKGGIETRAFEHTVYIFSSSKIISNIFSICDIYVNKKDYGKSTAVPSWDPAFTSCNCTADESK